MDIEKIKLCVGDDVTIVGLMEHSKASEKYINVEYRFDDGQTWKGAIPYFYRRTGLFIETEPEMCEYIKKIKHYFSKTNIAEFVILEKRRWENEMSGKEVTKSFFDILLNMQWNSGENLPNNPNWARRIQDIKEFGYTIATDITKRNIKIMLLPIPRGGVTGYETMSLSFKQRAIKALNMINVFDLSSANRHGLMPDHKFPEIRWDDTTRKDNEVLTEKEIKSKFQLLDNQRNQQKREICRKCFQTNKRGIILGIDYFYEGSIDWTESIPKVGASAERGCVGCAWYDIQKWRNSLNELLLNIK